MLLSSSVFAAAPKPQEQSAAANLLLMPDEKGVVLLVNNRVLAKVNGKAITVIDVQKKMDMLFLQAFPEYAGSKIALSQFYGMNWKSCLDDLIHKELVLADAEEMKMKVTNGDVRQEVESMFGPNVIANLDKVGLSLDEAWDLVKNDILIRRMMMARVNIKAMHKVYPLDVRKAYEDYVKNFDKSQEWVYQLITVRDNDSNASKSGASKISELLIADAVPLNDIVSYVKDHQLVASTSTVNVSEEFKHHDKEISENYKEILKNMREGQYSKPIETASRNDRKSKIYRVFYLKQIINHEPDSFPDMAIKLKNQLTDKLIAEESVIYLKKLREHYVVKDDEILKDLPPNFEPFVLKKQ